MRALFFRLVETADKGAALRAAIAGNSAPVRFEVDPSTFRAIPGSPFAYWVRDRVRQVFRVLRPYSSEDRDAKQGIATADDFRFVRVWWEMPTGACGSRWLPFVKGGRFAPFYSDVSAVLGWGEDGREMKAWAGSLYGGSHWSRILKNTDMFGQPGLTWPLRGIRFSAQAVPRGGAFSVGGKMAFAPSSALPVFLAIFNSRLWDHLVCLFAGKVGGVQYEVGLIKSLPVPDLTREDCDGLAGLASRAWSLKRALDTTKETSHAFLLPTGLNEKVTGLDPTSVERELAEIQRTINEEAYRHYDIGPEDRAAMESMSKETNTADAGIEDTEGEQDDSADDEAFICASTDKLLSWLVGVAFGRFDPRIATGERPIPPEPEPFDPLPARSPGFLPEGEDPADHPAFLIDDEGLADDLAACARAVAERVCFDVPANLRAWLAKEFFPLHIKMYSKSRRKAPIYWQLATRSASYSVWLYIHAFSKDTLFRVQNDYVAPKLAHEERRLESLTSELRDGATAAQRRALAAQQTFVEDLRALLEEVKRVAPLWKPNLDDGVIINFAPLWRLVPQHKPWQKECKACWDKLVAGDYDWAHLAMHLWPERVVPKCATDRSLAIAHGLEEEFWVEGEGGKWQARKRSQAEVQALVDARSKPTVKAALEDLLSAPAPVAGRATRSSAPKKQSRRVGPSVEQQPLPMQPRQSSAERSSDPDTQSLDAIRQALRQAADAVSKSDVLKATGLNDGQWNQAIKHLVTSGEVIKTGAAKGTRYRIAVK